MRYISTRGQSPPVSFLDAVLNGMAPDRGLYVPEEWPTLDRWRTSWDPETSFAAAAAEMLGLFAGDEIDRNTRAEICREAYATDGAAAAWDHPAVTRLSQFEWGRWWLELFHGPSLSFKDVALRMMGLLFDHVLSEREERRTVICATSGDTGGAAIQALSDRERLDVFVLLPRARISAVQRRFMTTSGSKTAFAVEIDGDFDACQAIVKTLFADPEFASRARLSAANSINWARIVAQSVYFVLASKTLGADGPVSFAVPTGNFGDAFSGFVAKQVGAPILRVEVATNANDIVARTIETGRYERSPSTATLSPAMDIQVASNFERIVFEAVCRDADEVRRLYAAYAQSGAFELPTKAHGFLRTHFGEAAADDARTLANMREVWERTGRQICPHTAVGFKVADNSASPIVFLATAHPAKFPEAVERATGVRPQLPAKCADLFEREERFDSLPADAEAVKRYIRERSRAWQ